MNQYCPTCGKYHESTTGGCFISNCYVQVVPDSQFFTSLEQIEGYAQGKGDKYLEIAVRNTIKNGYKLGKELFPDYLGG